MPAGQTVLSVVLIILAAVAVYGNTLHHCFLYDDHQTIVENELIKSRKNLPLMVRDDYYRLSGEQSYRPFVTLTYFLDYSIWKLNPFGYHLTNVLLHLINGVLLYFLLRLLLKKNLFALIFSVFFLVHPLVTEAVNCVSFREDLMTLTFCLLSFLFYLRGREDHFRRRKGALLYFLSSVCFILALLAKEMAISFPLILLLYEWMFPVKDKDESRAVFFRIYPYFLLLAIFLALRFTAFAARPDADYPIVPLSVRLFTTTRIVLTYFKLFVWPVALSAEYLFPLEDSLTPVVAGMIFGVVIIVCLLLIVSRRVSRETLFAAAWFLLSFLPIINVYPLKNAAAERYLYLPVAVFAVWLGTAAAGIYPRMRFGRRKIAAGLFFLVLAGFAARAVIRNLDWREEFGFYLKTLKSCPNSSRFHYNVGAYYMEQKKFETARKELNACLALAPDDYQAYNCLGIISAELKEDEPAFDYFWKSLRIRPDYGSAGFNLGNLYYRKEMLKEAIRPYQIALAQAPNNPAVMGNLIDIYLRLDMRREAIYFMEAWLKKYPTDVPALQQLGNVYLKEGAYGRAIALFEKILKQTPGEPLTLNNLGIAFYLMKDYEKARAYWEKALAAKPDLVHARKNLETLAQKKDTPPAIVELATTNTNRPR